MSLFSMPTGIVIEPGDDEWELRPARPNQRTLLGRCELRILEARDVAWRHRAIIYFVGLAGVCIFVCDGAKDWGVWPRSDGEAVDAQSLRGVAMHLLASFSILGTSEALHRGVRSPASLSPFPLAPGMPSARRALDWSGSS